MYSVLNCRNVENARRVLPGIVTVQRDYKFPETHVIIFILFLEI
jgi:hypothetical protein